MDFNTLYLSVECGTIEDDDTKIWPMSFELLPISELASDYGPNHEDIDNSSGKRIGTVQYVVNGIKHPPLYLDMDAFMRNGDTWWKWQCPQWPWAFATIMIIGDNNGKLAAYRMQMLLFILETLTNCNRHGNPILRFRAPIGMDVGERLEMHRLEQWIEAFDGVISF
ncbi:hypothetical protein CPB86DRAFT_787979 [Serendipita vermifera]|nr:hypothetical protein CPB86DRAFT_787979 [Serendipita vermifera]